MVESIDDKIPTEVREKVTQLDSFAKEYRMRLKGKSRQVDGSWKQTGLAIAGSDFIRLSSALIDPHSNNCNLISAKSMEKFLIQYNITFNTFNSLAAKSQVVESDHYDVITDSFRSACLNIGDIITSSQGDIFKIIKHPKQDDDEDAY